MNYVVVTNEWLAARNILPLPTMRKSKDGTKCLAHDEFFEAFKRYTEDGEDLDGLVYYPHNSKELNDLLASDEWTIDEANTNSVDFLQVAAINNLMNATKSNIQKYDLENTEVNQIVGMYPKWEELIGQTLEVGFKFQYNGKPYRVVQAHTTQEDWKPDEVKSLYNLVSNHDGTKEDPIPYEHWLVLDKDLYYIENDTLYLCVTDSIVGYDSDLSQLGALVQKVEQ